MIARRLPWLAVAGLLVALAWVGAEVARRPPPLNVLVLTVESWRADALDAAPRLLALAARRGIRYTNHRTVSAWTGTNVVTLLTGWSPFQHRVHGRDQRIAGTHDRALELLADRGWRVAGLQAFMRIPIFDQLGLGREGIGGGGDEQPLAWLRARAASGEPFFLWTHYLHSHLPYAPAPEFDLDWRALLPHLDEAVEARFAALRSRGKIETGTVAFAASDRPAITALYRAGVGEFDSWLARLWAGLEETGLAENTVVIVTADHGEELLERGEVGHASTNLAGHLHEEIVRVPLFLFLPPGVSGPAWGSVVERPSDHGDVMASVFALLGLAPPSGLAGADLRALPAMRPWTAATSRAGYSEPDPDHPSAMLFARADGRWKLHLSEPAEGAATVRLYDLDADPGETVDLAAARPEIVARLEAGILAERARALPPPPPPGAAAPPGPRPRWLRPAASGRYAFDHIGGRFSLEWQGPAEADYVIAYSYRDGTAWLGGEIAVSGTVYDFGAIDRRYWDTWLVPNGPYRVRVGYAGPEPRWSEWLELEAD